MHFLGTTTPLAGGATWNSAATGQVPGHAQLTNGADQIRGTVLADQGGTLFVEQSPDGTNWDSSTQFTVVGGTGQGFAVNVMAAYARLRYLNGATLQSTFRCFGRLHSNDQSNG